MGALAGRLARVEAALGVPEPAGPVSPEEQRRAATWVRAVEAVLEHTPPAWAARIVAELSGDPEGWSPLTCRALALAASAVPASLPECAFAVCACANHYGQHGPLALPEAVCALLDRQGDVVFDYLNCADCGYESGELSAAEWRRWRDEHSRPPTPEERAYFAVCPQCGGAVGWCAYQVARQYGATAILRHGG